MQRKSYTFITPVKLHEKINIREKTSVDLYTLPKTSSDTHACAREGGREGGKESARDRERERINGKVRTMERSLRT